MGLVGSCGTGGRLALAPEYAGVGLYLSLSSSQLRVVKATRPTASTAVNLRMVRLLRAPRTNGADEYHGEKRRDKRHSFSCSEGASRCWKVARVDAFGGCSSTCGRRSRRPRQDLRRAALADLRANLPRAVRTLSGEWPIAHASTIAGPVWS